ncbi:MAG: ABC transporter substrate-binding protein [Anaeroplasmataceae bacterium]
MKLNAKKLSGTAIFGVLAAVTLVSCSKGDSAVGWKRGTSNETIIKEAYAAGKLGNWGLGNEYEIYALEQKYGLTPKYQTQGFDMSQFDDDEITLASVMTYNELGLTKNSYTGALGYGDKVGVIDMNEEGVAMLEDCLFCSKSFAEANPNTVKAFIYASIKGWQYACANTDEAAQICVDAGSTVGIEHQKYMAQKIADGCTKDVSGNTVAVDLTMRDTALQSTLDQAKVYVASALTSQTAKTKLASMTLNDIRDASYLTAVQGADVTAAALKTALEATNEKKSVSIQLKWLCQAQFMGFYVAQAKGYFTEVGLTVNILTQSGDITETTYVANGNADFGHTWVSSLIAANASDAGLIELGQITQRSLLQLVYKYSD